MKSSQAYEASESHMLKVAALRLFHPAVSSVLFGIGFYYCDTVSGGGSERVRGGIES
jgi:hypothetical protein